jgi:hypothetical protein
LALANGTGGEEEALAGCGLGKMLKFGASLMLPVIGAFSALLLLALVAGFGLLVNLSDRQAKILIGFALFIAALFIVGGIGVEYYHSIFPFSKEKNTQAILKRGYLTKSSSGRIIKVTVYEYEAEGMKHEGQFSYEKGNIKRYVVGDTIDITYDAASPFNSVPSFYLYDKHLRPDMEKYVMKIKRGEGRRFYQ